MGKYWWGLSLWLGPKLPLQKKDSNLVSNPQHAGAGRDTVLIEKLRLRVMVSFAGHRRLPRSLASL